MNITDIECLDRSLKIRQFIRASSSKHTIGNIQSFCSNGGKSNKVIYQEFKKITTQEEVCRIAQESINILTDSNRKYKYLETGDSVESSKAIEQVSMIDIDTFLTRQSRVFLKCIYKPFHKEGIKSFLDLVREAETERDSSTSRRLESIIHAFPVYFRDMANSFNDKINIRNCNMSHILNVDGGWIPIEDITTRELQLIFKKVLNKDSSPNLKEKLEIVTNEPIDIIGFRQSCRNPKLRHIHYRLIHNDFYTYSKMYKFKMTQDSKCPRCSLEETTPHLLWECHESRKIWSLFNKLLDELQCSVYKIANYKDLYKTERNSAISIIKMKIIQQLIQIERPKDWCKATLVRLITQLIDYDFCYSKGKNEIDRTKLKWGTFLKLKIS